MKIDTEIHKKILVNLIDKLVGDYGENEFLIQSRLQLLEYGISIDTIKNILYGVLSLYLIDEITLQPAEKMNLIDMGSYYYRSESFSIDFPPEFHNRYQIPYPHIERKASIFYSSKNFIQKYLKLKQDEELISISVVKTEDPDLRMPSSRQMFLVEYFLLYPNFFEEMVLTRYSSKFKDSEVFKIRSEKHFDKFIHRRVIEDGSDNEIRKNLTPLFDEHHDYVLTSSGTAANELVIQYLDCDNQKNFYHKYWYFENLGDKDSLYFNEIENNAVNFDNFFVNIQPTNYLDKNDPLFFENIKEKLSDLLKKLEKGNKKYNVVVDVTSNPFLDIQTNAANINIIKTISLSKYQEGINTNFAGIVIAKKSQVSIMESLSNNLGFGINELDKRFLFLPDIDQYRKRIQKIEDFISKQSLDYLGWKIYPTGLSMVLIPESEMFNQHVSKFSNQTFISDRKFSWLIRDRVNELIKSLNITDIFFGDSFLFPTSRINIQGPTVNASEYSKNTHIFKYRLPRISHGYNADLKNEKLYNELYKGVIDVYMDEYSKL